MQILKDNHLGKSLIFFHYAKALLNYLQFAIFADRMLILLYVPHKVRKLKLLEEVKCISQYAEPVIWIIKKFKRRD